MHRHWAAFGPPAYVALAAQMGLAGRGKSSRRIDEPDDLADLLAAMPGGARV